MGKEKVNTDILPDLVATAGALNADALEIEYQYDTDEVRVLKNGLCLDIAYFDASGKESRTLRRELQAMAGKKKILKADEITYILNTMLFKSFDEDFFIVEIKKAKPKRQIIYCSQYSICGP